MVADQFIARLDPVRPALQHGKAIVSHPEINRLYFSPVIGQVEEFLHINSLCEYGD